MSLYNVIKVKSGYFVRKEDRRIILPPYFLKPCRHNIPSYKKATHSNNFLSKSASFIDALKIDGSRLLIWVGAYLLPNWIGSIVCIPRVSSFNNLVKNYFTLNCIFPLYWTVGILLSFDHWPLFWYCTIANYINLHVSCWIRTNRMALLYCVAIIVVFRLVV